MIPVQRRARADDTQALGNALGGAPIVGHDDTAALHRRLGAEREVVVDGQPARVVFDLLNAPRAEINAYLNGRVDGFLDGEAVGFARGYAACDDELSRLQRAAHRNVQALSRILPHVEREQRRRDAQVDLAEQHAREARPWAQEATR